MGDPYVNILQSCVNIILVSRAVLNTFNIKFSFQVLNL